MAMLVNLSFIALILHQAVAYHQVVSLEQADPQNETPARSTPPRRLPPAGVPVLANVALSSVQATAVQMPQQRQLPQLLPRDTQDASASPQMLRAGYASVQNRAPEQLVPDASFPVAHFAVPTDSVSSTAFSDVWAPDWAKWAALVISAAKEIVTRAWMAFAGLSFVVCVKASCIASNLLFQVSPFPEARGWVKKGSTGAADSAPYVSIALAGCQWCFYGTFAFLVTGERSFFVLLQSNGLGALLGTYYVLVFLRNCKEKVALESLYQYLSAVGSLVFLQISAVLMLPTERALLLAGLIGSFCAFLSATSLLVTLPTVIKTQDSSSIPGLLVLVGLFSAVAWCICGRLLDDPMIMVPNLYGACATSAALGVKLRYLGASSGKADKATKAKGITTCKEDVPLMAPFEKVPKSQMYGKYLDDDVPMKEIDAPCKIPDDLREMAIAFHSGTTGGTD